MSILDNVLGNSSEEPSKELGMGEYFFCLDEFMRDGTLVTGLTAEDSMIPNSVMTGVLGKSRNGERWMIKPLGGNFRYVMPSTVRPA